MSDNILIYDYRKPNLPVSCLKELNESYKGMKSTKLADKDKMSFNVKRKIASDVLKSYNEISGIKTERVVFMLNEFNQVQSIYGANILDSYGIDINSLCEFTTIINVTRQGMSINSVDSDNKLSQSLNDESGESLKNKLVSEINKIPEEQSLATYDIFLENRYHHLKDSLNKREKWDANILSKINSIIDEVNKDSIMDAKAVRRKCDDIALLALLGINIDRAKEGKKPLSKLMIVGKNAIIDTESNKFGKMLDTELQIGMKNNNFIEFSMVERFENNCFKDNKLNAQCFRLGRDFISETAGRPEDTYLITDKELIVSTMTRIKEAIEHYISKTVGSGRIPEIYNKRKIVEKIVNNNYKCRGTLN